MELSDYLIKQQELVEIIRVFTSTRDWRIRAVLVDQWQEIFRQLLKESSNE